MQSIMTILKKKSLATMLIILFLLTTSVQAATSPQDLAKNGLKNVNTTALLAEGSPAATIGAGISVLLGALGLVLLIIIVYAGILWMSAVGDKSAVEKAKGMIVQGVIGLGICLLAYSITTFVVDQLATVVTK